MKKRKSFKDLESLENSLKGKSRKSTNENTIIYDKIKSTHISQKASEISSIKRSKNVILCIKNNHKINNANKGYNQNKKLEKTKTNKNSKLKKDISRQKDSKTLIKNKTENKINKSLIIKKSSELTATSSPAKRLKKETKPQLVLTNSRVKFEKKFIHSQKILNNSHFLKKKTNNLKDKIFAHQNTKKNKKIQKIQNIKNNIIKGATKKRRKFSFDSNYTKLKLPSKEIKISKKYYSPPIKHYIKRLNENKNNKMNKAFTRKITNHNKILNKENKKNRDKPKLLNKIRKNKFIFGTLVYRNKEHSARDKLMSFSRTKNINSYTIPRKKKSKNSKNKTMEDFHYSNNNSILRKKINFAISKTERGSKDNLKEKQNYKNETICDLENITINKKFLNSENDNYINKKVSDNFNNKKKLNYLRLTVSALNKMVENKKSETENNKDHISIKIRSKTIEKDIKSIKRKYKEKSKYVLIHRNTITNYKMREKNYIKNSMNIAIQNYSTIPNSTKTNNKKIDDYEVIKELGKGSYASVKLVIHKVNNNKYAMKVYSKKSLLDPQKKNTVSNEIEILKQLDNINIMKLYDVIETSNYLYLIMEYIEGISLLDTIKKDKNHYFEEQRALKIFSQIIKAIIYCQSKNISHRDIKLENILVIKNDIIKLIDFGFAVKADKETYQNLFCGSPSYMAPEIVNKEKYIAQYSDIWSLGVLFFSMLYGRFPFKAKTQNELFKKINEANVEFPNDVEVNDKIKILLKKIFVIIPAQRPSLQEILNDILLLIN